MLEKFAAAKAAEIADLKAREREGRLPPVWVGERPPFAPALEGRKPLAVIAEYKRASPSKGVICLELSAADVAAQFVEAGAAALSVLTEETHFQGSLDYLAQARAAAPGAPLLRKDFLLHPLQVRATAATPASALLLIARMLDEDLLAEMLDLAGALGLAAVVEVFDEADLKKARAVGAGIIQVNNRDLDTLAVDLAVSRRLALRRRPGEIWIRASGVDRGAQLRELAGLGFDAVLVGASLMAGGRPGQALATLLSEAVDD
ncbi:MAG: indole-3-glycerol-phosphate synthase [Thermodesulfobacteriota bacterium]